MDEQTFVVVESLSRLKIFFSKNIYKRIEDIFSHDSDIRNSLLYSLSPCYAISGIATVRCFKLVYLHKDNIVKEFDASF